MKDCKTTILIFLIVLSFWSNLRSQTITNPRTPAEFEEVKGVVIRWDEKEYYKIFLNVQTQGWTAYWSGRYTGTMNTQATIIREALNEGVDAYVLDDTSHTSYYGSYLYSDYHVADTLIALGIPPSSHLHIIPYPAIDNTLWRVWIRDWGQYNVYKNGNDSSYIVGRDLDTTIGRYFQKPFISNNVIDGGNFCTDGQGRLFCDQWQPYIDQQLFGINDIVIVANYKIHIDYYMRLINEETFFVNEIPASNHDPSIDTFFGDSTTLEGAIAAVKQKSSCFGRPYKFVRIRNAPTYNKDGVTYITSEAGYVNSLFLNRTVLVPTYDNLETDTLAINTYKKYLPGHRIVAIPSKYYAARQGAIHCITKELAVDEPIFIAHAWLPDTIEDNPSQYEIKAYVKTRSGINHADVYWSTNPQVGFQSIPMTPTANDTFVVYIPGQSSGNVLSYYISATANSGKQSVKPIVAPNGYYSTVLKGIAQLSAPTLIAWTGSSASSTIHWNSSVGATKYWLQVATDSIFTNVIDDYPSLTDTFQVVGQITAGVRYYCRVAAKDSSRVSGWSNIKYFDAVSNVITFNYNVGNGWNLISLSMTVSDFRKSMLFPTAASGAFGYEGNYIAKDTLTPGVGYWLKFSSQEIIQINGIPITAETLDVYSGWNLIGSVGAAVPVTAITTVPPAMTASNVFGFNGTYAATDSIRPTQGYWIKVSNNGKLILSSSNGPSTSRIRIISKMEMPPRPPEDVVSTTSVLPEKYFLEQNYPNPFNPTTQITYTVPILSDVTLKVYDLLGRDVATLVNEKKEAGRYSVQWDGDRVPSGVYVYRIVAGDPSFRSGQNFVETKKMILMR